jgi:hypothetical protein
MKGSCGDPKCSHGSDPAQGMSRSDKETWKAARPDLLVMDSD